MAFSIVDIFKTITGDKRNEDAEIDIIRNSPTREQVEQSRRTLEVLDRDEARTQVTNNYIENTKHDLNLSNGETSELLRSMDELRRSNEELREESKKTGLMAKLDLKNRAKEFILNDPAEKIKDLYANTERKLVQVSKNFGMLYEFFRTIGKPLIMKGLEALGTRLKDFAKNSKFLNPTESKPDKFFPDGLMWQLRTGGRKFLDLMSSVFLGSSSFLDGGSFFETINNTRSDRVTEDDIKDMDTTDTSTKNASKAVAYIKGKNKKFGDNIKTEAVISDTFDKSTHDKIYGNGELSNTDILKNTSEVMSAKVKDYESRFDSLNDDEKNKYYTAKSLLTLTNQAIYEGKSLDTLLDKNLDFKLVEREDKVSVGDTQLGPTTIYNKNIIGDIQGMSKEDQRKYLQDIVNDSSFKEQAEYTVEKRDEKGELVRNENGEVVKETVKNENYEKYQKTKQDAEVLLAYVDNDYSGSYNIPDKSGIIDQFNNSETGKDININKKSKEYSNKYSTPSQSNSVGISSEDFIQLDKTKQIFESKKEEFVNDKEFYTSLENFRVEVNNKSVNEQLIKYTEIIKEMENHQNTNNSNPNVTTNVYLTSTPQHTTINTFKDHDTFNNERRGW